VTVQGTFLLANNTSGTAGLVAGYTGSGDGLGTMYSARVLVSNGTYTALIELVSGGAFFPLASTILNGFNGSVSHTLQFVVNGTSPQLFLDNLNTPLLTATLCNPATAGLVGMRGRNASFSAFNATSP